VARKGRNFKTIHPIGTDINCAFGQEILMEMCDEIAGGYQHAVEKETYWQFIYY